MAMRNKVASSLAFLFFIGFPALAFGSATITAGTPVPVVLAENVNSSLNTIGETIFMKVTEDVKVGNQVVIPKGARVKAQIGSIGERGMMGKGGDLNFSPVSVEAIDGSWIPLDKEAFGARGKGATGGELYAMGFLAKGRAGYLLREQPYEVTIRRDTVVDTSKVAPRPALKEAALKVPAKFQEVPDIKFSRAAEGKSAKDIVLEIQATPEIMSLLPQDARSVEIVQVLDDLLHKPVKSTAVERDGKRENSVKAAFDWWSLIRYAKPGATPVVAQYTLTDGRLVQAEAILQTEWKLK